MTISIFANTFPRHSIFIRRFSGLDNTGIFPDERQDRVWVHCLLVRPTLTSLLFYLSHATASFSRLSLLPLWFHFRLLSPRKPQLANIDYSFGCMSSFLSS